MKILTKNHIENAIESLRSNRGRTFLSITGVAIGIASITVILSIAGGFAEFFGHETTNSSPVAIVKSGGNKDKVALLTETDTTTVVNTISEKDVNDIGRITGINSAPIAFLHTNLKTRNEQIDAQHTALIGSTGSLKNVANLEVAVGQFISNGSSIVVGHQLSIDLFGTENSIGNVITIHEQPFTVVGVLKKVDSTPSYLSINFDNVAIIPLSQIKKFTQNAAQIQQIIITAPDQTTLNNATVAVNTALKTNHHDNQDYRIVSGNAIDEHQQAIVELFSVIMAVIGGVSLLVGSIGIMNIMLVNVTERRREISIRRSVGATNLNIINQFLIESAIIGLIGGILGYLLGLGGAYLASSQLPFTPYIYWQTAALTITLSTIIGITAGIYPAAQAIRQNPVESLRY